MGTYDNSGKPTYLITPNAVISAQFLASLTAALPEGKAVYIYHPTYLTNSAETNINVTLLSDIYFTFVTEGAGYRIAIAYFTCPTGTPPPTTASIDSLYIILPNAILSGSRGSLVSGNTINLGTLKPGTSIGFALIADAWNGTTVGNGYWINYTIDALNPATTTNLKRQFILLYDNPSDLFLIGFEDIRRDNSNCE